MKILCTVPDCDEIGNTLRSVTYSTGLVKSLTHFLNKVPVHPDSDPPPQAITTTTVVTL